MARATVKASPKNATCKECKATVILGEEFMCSICGDDLCESCCKSDQAHRRNKESGMCVVVPGKNPDRTGNAPQRMEVLVAKTYDCEAIVSALLYAQDQWRKNGRVERKTYLRLRCLMSQKVINRMTGQLIDYHNPMSTMKAVQDLFELPEWRKAWAWARKGCSNE